VVALNESDVDSLVAAFESDFYIDADSARTAILSERMFNLMHLESGVKVLSKLVWALESNSELQRRDIHQLLAGEIDLDYIRKWAPQLGVTTLLNELMP